jgi:uncharacterized protein (DUF1778 family)
MVRPKIQIDISPEARAYLKSLAYSRGQSLTEYILKAAADAGDAKAKRLIEESIKLKNKKAVNKRKV